MSEQFERNHQAIHQAEPGTCQACDKVLAEKGDRAIVQVRRNSRSRAWDTTDVPSSEVNQRNMEYGWHKYRVIEVPAPDEPGDDEEW
jgi:NMD protein affecting ribosome stability and mRNA decay